MELSRLEPYKISDSGEILWSRKYGGIGHNGADYTSDGKYALFGGPNPTLFDTNGNVLWQREKDAKVQMTGVMEIDTGGANDIWLSGDASLIILGGDNGKITFYKGEVKNGTNDYTQLVGPNTDRPKSSPKASANRASQDGPAVTNGVRPNYTTYYIIGGVILLAVVVVAVILVLRKKKSING